MTWMLLLVLAAAPADSQPAPPTAPVSVYRVSWIEDASVTLALGAGVALTYDLSTRLIRPRCPCPISEVPAYDRWSLGFHSDAADVASDFVLGAVVLGPLLWDLRDVGFSEAWAQDAEVMAESLAINGALVTLLKYLIQRPVPLVYSGAAPALTDTPEGYRSFYSGHTALAMGALATFAMTELYRHDERIWPWIVAGAGGLTVGALRILAGRHFMSDVLVGLVVGAAVGVLVPAMHHNRLQNVAVAPAPGRMFAVWSIAF